jgi:predicted HTH transcriptional regulator
MMNLTLTQPPDDMPTLQCPHCGYSLELTRDSTERQIIRAIRKLERHNGTASTRAVALEISLSHSQTGRRLRNLAERGAIRRIGKRRGWKSAA